MRIASSCTTSFDHNIDRVACPQSMAAMTSSFVGNTQAFQAQVAAPRTGHVRTCRLISHSPSCRRAIPRALDASGQSQRKPRKWLMSMQGKLATVMRRTVKGGGGKAGSAAGTAGQPSNITWYGPGKRHAGPVSPWVVNQHCLPTRF